MGPGSWERHLSLREKRGRSAEGKQALTSLGSLFGMEIRAMGEASAFRGEGKRKSRGSRPNAEESQPRKSEGGGLSGSKPLRPSPFGIGRPTESLIRS